MSYQDVVVTTNKNKISQLVKKKGTTYFLLLINLIDSNRCAILYGLRGKTQLNRKMKYLKM